MAEWMSDEWAAQAAAFALALPEADALDGTVSLAVGEGSGRAKREVGFRWRYAGGAVVEGNPGVDPEAQLVLTLSAPDALDVLSGSVEPSVSFMRGRLKASGDGALLLGFLSSTTSPGFEEWRRGVAALSPQTAG